MTADEIRARKSELIARHGPWTAHCIHLGEGVYTFDVPQTDSKLRRFVQIAADISGKPLDSLRVLDLACLEGHYGIEFALHGAQVLAIEGRETNLAKARFVKELLSLDRLELALEDVRGLDAQRHGCFDVVLCLGILYHLDSPDAMEFMERVAGVCSRVAIIDTHISLGDEVSVTWKGKTYWGAHSPEHADDATPEQKLASLWYSLDNVRSFKFTRASLCNLLRNVGFTSVFESLTPYEYHYPTWPKAVEGDSTVVWKDRLTLVAIKGEQQSLLSSPVSDGSAEIDRPERPETRAGGRSRPTQ